MQIFKTVFWNFSMYSSFKELKKGYIGWIFIIPHTFLLWNRKGMHFVQQLSITDIGMFMIVLQSMFSYYESIITAWPCECVWIHIWYIEYDIVVTRDGKTFCNEVILTVLELSSFFHFQELCIWYLPHMEYERHENKLEVGSTIACSLISSCFSRMFC